MPIAKAVTSKAPDLPAAAAENPFFAAASQALAESQPARKCAAIHDLFQRISQYEFACEQAPQLCRLPGYPESLELVAPRQLARRGLASQLGCNVFMHAIAHIEYNAMNLALDAAYRFREMPTRFYHDWMRVAADEARHFTLIEQYLNENDSGYGAFPAHNGLWEMAEKTAHDVVARMALVPRVLEARGLDVTPKMISRLEQIGDRHAVSILQTIYQDEIEHVDTGSWWFRFTCEQQGHDPHSHFFALVEHYLHGELRGPFNLPARLKAGFAEEELATLKSRYDN